MIEWFKDLKSRVRLALLVACSVCFMLSLIGCKRRPNRIDHPLVISPEGEYVAFRSGPLWWEGGDTGVEPTEGQIYVGKLGKGISQIRLVPESMTSLSTAWRPKASPPELFVTTFPIGPGMSSHIVAVAVSNGLTTTLSHNLTNASDMIYNLSWSPNGRILAANIHKFEGHTFKGFYLGISYDGGKSFLTTDIALKGKIVWTNNETLYVQDGNKILELVISDKQVKVRRTVASQEDIFLAGKSDGKVVYCSDNEIYYGDQLLSTLDKTLEGITTDGSYIAVQTTGCIYVFNNRGDIENKKNIDEDAELAALSATQKFVYLMKNYESVERYNFESNSEITTLFRANEIKSLCRN